MLSTAFGIVDRLRLFFSKSQSRYETKTTVGGFGVRRRTGQATVRIPGTVTHSEGNQSVGAYETAESLYLPPAIAISHGSKRSWRKAMLCGLRRTTSSESQTWFSFLPAWAVDAVAYAAGTLICDDLLCLVAIIRQIVAVGRSISGFRRVLLYLAKLSISIPRNTSSAVRMRKTHAPNAAQSAAKT